MALYKPQTIIRTLLTTALVAAAIGAIGVADAARYELQQTRTVGVAESHHPMDLHTNHPRQQTTTSAAQMAKPQLPKTKHKGTAAAEIAVNKTPWPTTARGRTTRCSTEPVHTNVYRDDDATDNQHIFGPTMADIADKGPLHDNVNSADKIRQDCAISDRRVIR